METADPRVLYLIRALGREEQERIVLELTKYATNVITWKACWLERGLLPKGMDGADIAAEALGLVLVGKRKWNPDEQPDLLAYLRSVVDSLLSHLLDSEERKRTVRPPEDEGREDPISIAPDGGLLPDEQLLEAEQAERDKATCDAMMASLKDEEEQLVFLGFLEEKKPAEIAEDFGLDVKRVYQVKQNIFRRLSAKKPDEKMERGR